MAQDESWYQIFLAPLGDVLDDIFRSMSSQILRFHSDTAEWNIFFGPSPRHIKPLASARRSAVRSVNPRLGKE